MASKKSLYQSAIYYNTTTKRNSLKGLDIGIIFQSSGKIFIVIELPQ